jgi:hypothetical protein
MKVLCIKSMTDSFCSLCGVPFDISLDAYEGTFDNWYDFEWLKSFRVGMLSIHLSKP